MKRNIKLSVRLNENEHAHLNRLAEKSALKKEPLIRSLIMGREIKARPTPEYLELLRELSAIGNNINQIARIANTCGNVEREQIRDIVGMFNGIWAKVKGG